MKAIYDKPTSNIIFNAKSLPTKIWDKGALLPLLFKTVRQSDIKKKETGARFGSTYTKIGTVQRRRAWPLCKDDMQIHEAFHIFLKRNTFESVLMRWMNLETIIQSEVRER